MFRRIRSIAVNTFREAVRDRVLYGVLGFAGAVLLFTLALAELSLNQQRRIVVDLGLASISLFSVLVAIFLGSSLLYKEIERKTLYVILPKPIARFEFLLGKYFGIVLTAVVFIAIMGAIQLWVTGIQADAPLWAIVSAPLVLVALLGLGIWRARDKTSVLVPWSALAFGACCGVPALAGVDITPMVAAMILSVGEVLLVAAVAILFSSFSTPFLTGIFTLGVWLVGRSADDLANMKTKLFGDTIKSILAAIAEVAPNLNLFVPGRHTLETAVARYGSPLTYVATSMGYAVLYSAILLVFASMIFRKRDFL